MLRGDEKFAAKSGFGGTAVESFSSGKVDEVGIVVGFGDVGEDKEAGAGVETVGGGEVFANNMIGEMAIAAHNALLDVPRIRADLEHFEIVIGFQDEAISVAQMEFDQFRKIPQVGNDGDFGAVGAECVAHRIRGVVRNGEWGNFDVADGEFFAGADVFDAIEFFRGGFRQEAENFRVSTFGEIGRGAKVAQELGKSAGVIGVLVGNQNGVDAIGIFVESGETAKGFFAAKSGVNEKTGALGFKQRGIAGTAGSENGNSKTDKTSLAAPLLRDLRGMMTKGRRFVNEKG